MPAVGAPNAFTEARRIRSEAKEELMKLFKAVKTVCLTVLVGAALATGARADDWNRKTVVTFSAAVEIPGVHLAGWGVLPAGTYVFKILDSTSDRHIVQIFNKEETTVYATILAIPNYRLQATDKTVMTFRERPAGEPEALRAWFYPGKNWGEEFVYPKAQAIEFAKTSTTPVLEMPASVAVEAAKPEEPKVIAELKQTPVTAVEPSGKEVEIAQAVTPPPAAETLVAQATPPAEPALPKTASPLPLIALVGLLALGGGLTLRAVATRSL